LIWKSFRVWFERAFIFNSHFIKAFIIYYPDFKLIEGRTKKANSIVFMDVFCIAFIRCHGLAANRNCLKNTLPLPFFVIE
jgi:hypothetical protein